MKTAAIEPNGTPGHYQVRYGPIEKAIAGILITLIGVGVAGGVAMYREVGVIASRQEANAAAAIQAAHEAAAAASAVADKLDRHLEYSRDIVPNLLTREEYQRDHAGREHR